MGRWHGRGRWHFLREERIDAIADGRDRHGDQLRLTEWRPHGELERTVRVDATSKTWTFALTAASGADGARSTTVTSSNDPGCATVDGTMAASYKVDNTAPTVAATLSPLPNAAGWNSSDVTVTWSATDAGSGVASGPTPGHGYPND